MRKILIGHKNSIPRVDMPLCYVQVCNHEKIKCTRSQFTEILFINFHQLAIMAKAFIRHQNSVPKGLSARAPGLCTCKKSRHCDLKSGALTTPPHGCFANSNVCDYHIHAWNCLAKKSKLKSKLVYKLSNLSPVVISTL